MEGYTNVTGNHKDFDNLDIEERHKDDDDLDDDDLEDMNKENEDRKRLLDIKVKLEGGGYGYVFSLGKSTHVLRWNCHLCGEHGVGRERVDTHILGKKHQVKMAMPSHPRGKFTRKDGETEDVPTLAPGEPIPPGFEDKLLLSRGVAQIQATLDRHTSSSLVGLEYLVELTPVERDNEPMYVCVLCDKGGDPRVAMAHITSYNHRSKYLGINFPKASRAIALALPRSKEGRKGNAEIVSKICGKIEEKHGRLQPLVLDTAVYEAKKDFYRQKLENDRHFRETEEENYMDIVNSLTTTYSINLDDVPLPTAQPDKQEDPKRKIGVDRSRLRAHPGKEDEKDKKEANSTDNKTPGNSKRRTRSNSLSSLTSISSSSLSRSPSRSRSRSRERRRSHRHSLDKHSRRHKSSRRHSRSHGRRSRSRSRRSRSRSRNRRSRSRSHHRSRNRSRSRSSSRCRYRGTYRPSRNLGTDEKEKWKNFREELDKVEQKLIKSLKFHEKNPEKHPMYPEEWKKFWNRRYKELQASGQDPSKYDFKPEWIEFWNKRMKEMHEEELQKAKEELRQALNLPKEGRDPAVKRFVKRPHPPPPPRPMEVDDDIIVISPPLHGKEMKMFKKERSRKRSPSPWDEEESYRMGRGWPRSRAAHSYATYHRPPEKPHYEEDDPIGQSDTVKVVTVLRLLTAMEAQLGSLGPTVNNLLASALAMEKTRPGLSESLLGNPDNLVVFDTVKEKLKGQLFAGIVEQGLMLATRSCVQNLAQLLYRAEKIAHETGVTPPAPTPPKPVLATMPSSVTEPIPVPGVGAMDKLAIAEQIAKALVAQGKTDVTQEQLEQLINAVVGMAHASSTMDTPITAAAFASMQQAEEPPKPDLKPKEASPPLEAVSPTPTFEDVVPPAVSPPRIVPTSKTPVPRVASPVPVTDDKSPLERLLSVVHAKTTPVVKQTPEKPAPVVKPKPKPTPLFPCIETITPKAVPTTTTVSSPMKKRERESDSLSEVKKMTTSQMEDLNESDLKELLQNFCHLSTEEQHCLIAYLKKMEAKEPDRVEKLRKFVNLNPNQPPVKKKMQSIIIDDDEECEPGSWRSGRLSPFSMRLGVDGKNPLEGVNPSQDETTRLNNRSSKKIELDDSDDDYSFEDICAAANRKVTEKEKAQKEKAEKEKEEEKARQAEEVARSFDFDIKPLSKLEEEDALKSSDHSAVLRETKLMVANIMGQIPLKLNQNKASPALSTVSNSTPSRLALNTTPTVNTPTRPAITTPTRPMITTPTKPIITTPTEELPKKGVFGTNIDISNMQKNPESSVGGTTSGINVLSTTRPVPTLVSTNMDPVPDPHSYPLPQHVNYNGQYAPESFHEDPQVGQGFMGSDHFQEPLNAYQGGYGQIQPQPQPQQFNYGGGPPNYNGYYQEQYPPNMGRYGPPPNERPMNRPYGGPPHGGPPPHDRFYGQGQGYNQYGPGYY